MIRSWGPVATWGGIGPHMRLDLLPSGCNVQVISYAKQYLLVEAG